MDRHTGECDFATLGLQGAVEFPAVNALYNVFNFVKSACPSTLLWLDPAGGTATCAQALVSRRNLNLSRVACVRVTLDAETTAHAFVTQMPGPWPRRPGRCGRRGLMPGRAGLMPGPGSESPLMRSRALARLIPPRRAAHCPCAAIDADCCAALLCYTFECYIAFRVCYRGKQVWFIA